MSNFTTSPSEAILTPRDVRQKASDALKAFQRRESKIVGSLRQEFFRKKSASEYARSQTSKKGTLDVNKLHAYKYDDDIFQSVTRVQDAKNHGLFFLLDFSRSMNNALPSVCRHLLRLILFCEAVGIPYEAYGFTTKLVTRDHGTSGKGQINSGHLKIFQLIRSDAPKDVITRAKEDLLLINGESALSEGEELQLTPLTEALIVANKLVKRFKQKHNIEVPNFVLFSDGYGNGQISVRSGESQAGAFRTSSTYHGKLCGRYVTIRGGDIVDGKSVVRNIRETCGANTLCYFLTNNSSRSGKKMKREKLNELEHEHGINPKTVSNELKRNQNFWSAEDVLGFDRYVIIDDISYSTHNVTLKDRQCSSSKISDIRNTFIGHTKAKKGDKLFVRTFIDTIAEKPRSTNTKRRRR